MNGARIPFSHVTFLLSLFYLAGCSNDYGSPRLIRRLKNDLEQPNVTIRSVSVKPRHHTLSPISMRDSSALAHLSNVLRKEELFVVFGPVKLPSNHPEQFTGNINIELTNGKSYQTDVGYYKRDEQWIISLMVWQDRLGLKDPDYYHFNLDLDAAPDTFQHYVAMILRSYDKLETDNAEEISPE